MSYISKVPYRCPKCGDLKSFPSLRELKMHLDEEHSFRSMQERQRSRVFTPLSKQKYASRRNHSGRLSPLSLSLSEDARALEERLKRAKEAESAHRLGHSVKPDGHNHLNDTITMLSRDVMQARQNQWNTADALYHSQDVLEGLQLSADQQSKQQTENVAKLKNDLEQKERNLSKVNKDLENVTRERIKLEAEKLALAQRMEESSGKVTNLESQMREKTEMLKQKDREHKELMKFLEGAARKESVAREKLEDFINGILDRAEKAEQELHQIKNQMNAPPVPKDVLNYLAHTRPSKQAQPLPQSPVPQRAHPVPAEPTYAVYNAKYDSPTVPPQGLPVEYNKVPVHRKPRQPNKASPSQSIRSRDSGIPEDVVQAEKYKAVSHTPLQKQARRTYYGYEDESDYEDYRPTDAFDNEDYSISQSDAPNLAMLGNESDSPNEFYHSSDEGIPDYYLDSDGILWDETVLSSGKALTERAGLHRTSPSGSESGGQVIQTNTPADIYANTIKARTSFSTTQKPPFPHQSSSRRNSINQPSPSKYASPTGSGGKNANKSVSSKNEQPYNKEDYIKSVKNNARVNASPSSTDATASATRAKSKDKHDIKSDHGKKSMSRQNSSSSGDNATPKSTSSLNSGNVFVAIADVHVNATLSDSDTAETLKRPIPAKRGKKSEAHAIPEEGGSKEGTRNHGSFPRNREKSEHLLQVKEESPQFNSLPSRNVQKHLSNSSDTPLTSESTDISFETVKRKSIKKQPSIGKINSTDRPPKPLRQSSTGSTTSHDNSQTLSDKAKASPAPVNTGVKTPDEAASPKRGQLQPKLSRDLSVNIPEDSIHSVSPIRIQMEDLQMMTDVEEDPTLHDAGVGPSGPQPSARVEEIKRRRLTLMCVFLYLDTKTLSQLSLVCKEWKVVSRHPALWRRVRLRNARIGSKYLMTISKWCVQLESLTLEALKPRRKRKDETDEDYAKNTRGCLEQGLETLLMVSQNSLLSLRIASCDNIITEKCLWEVSCYSRLLQRLCYISSMDPLGPEVMWNMGAGCRDIVTLIIPPGVPKVQYLNVSDDLRITSFTNCSISKKPGRFNNKCVQLIGQFYPELKVLSIGGAEVDERGLLALVKQCQRLQVLEFDHMKEITEEVAQTLCDAGLKDLQTLEFTNTPVTPKAVHLFSKNCRRLRRINVRVAISDYFEDTLLKENVDHFKNVVEKFNSLKKRSNLSSVLRIKTDAEGKQRLRST